jgi:hypothetical protein
LILSASDVPLEDISQLVGHVSTSVTETVYRHEIRPALTKGATAMDKVLQKKNKTALPLPGPSPGFTVIDSHPVAHTGRSSAERTPSPEHDAQAQAHCPAAPAASAH